MRASSRLGARGLRLMISSDRYSTFFFPLDRVMALAAGFPTLGPCCALGCSTTVASLPPLPGAAGAASGGAPFAGAANVAAATAAVSAPFAGGAGGAPLPGAAGAPPVGATGGAPFAAGAPLPGRVVLARSESSLPPLRFESCCGSSAGSGVFGLAGCFGAIFLGATLSETAQPEHTTNALKDQGRRQREKPNLAKRVFVRPNSVCM